MCWVNHANALREAIAINLRVIIDFHTYLSLSLSLTQSVFEHFNLRAVYIFYLHLCSM